MIARILLGLIFVFFGSNILIHFLPTPPMPPGPMANFSGAMFATHYIHVVGFLQVVSGLFLLVGRYVPLALTILAPIIFNILLFHITMNPEGIVPGLVVTILWFLVFWRFHPAFHGILMARAPEERP
jgi:hypothetical protein